MQTRTLRDLTVLLPGDEPDDLDPIDYTPRQGASVAERVITADVWARAELTGVTVARSWLINADLGAGRFDAVTLNRCVFQGCSLIGANWDSVTLKNVIFENCRLDYATFSALKATGPVAMIGCALTETTFAGKLTPSLFDHCKFSATDFGGCDLRGADLRGNDITGLTGVLPLRGACFSPSQLPELTELLINDLALKIQAEPAR